MRASGSHTRALRALGPCVLVACAAACSVYDPGRLEPTSELGEAAPPSAPPSQAGASAVAGSGGMGAAGDGGREAPSEPMPVDAATPDTDEDAGAPIDPPLELRDRKRITIDEQFVDEDLRDFPLWVSLVGDADLMRARADGRSLYFTDELGQVLDAEIESRDLAAGDLTAWVRVPLVSGTRDTVLYLYWDDGLDHSAQQSATGVWSGGYEAVFHLSDARDSAEQALHGEDVGSEPTTGRLGGARSFDGKDYISVGQGKLPEGQSYTVTAWIKPDLSRCTEYCAVVTNSRTESPFEGISLYVAGHFAVQATGALGTFEETDPIADSWRFSEEHVVESDEWRYVALTMQIDDDEGSAAISLDGAPWADLHVPADGDTLGFQNAPDGHLDIGRFHGADGFFHEYAGAIDELRIASAARSAAWIRAEHENQRDGSAFYDVRTERR